MPTRRRHRSKSHRRKSRRVGPSLSRPVFHRKKRVNQNLTRDVKWFKRQTGIASNTAGNFRAVYEPSNIELVDDFQRWAANWEEYKVLGMYVKFIPAFVGSENTTNYRRGNAITFFDQGTQDNPTTFNQIMVKPSAKLMNPRVKHTRWCNRPHGYPRWGTLDNTGVIVDEDSWQDTRLQIFGINFTPVSAPGAQVFYFVEIGYKVVFRGRQSSPVTSVVTIANDPCNVDLPEGFCLGLE